MPRERLLLWKACTNAIPVKENLCRHKYLDNLVCILCGDEIDTMAHLLIYCRAIQPIWYASGLRIDM